MGRLIRGYWVNEFMSCIPSMRVEASCLIVAYMLGTYSFADYYDV